MRWLQSARKKRGNGMRRSGAPDGLRAPKRFARARKLKSGSAMSSRKWIAASSSTGPPGNGRRSARPSRLTSRRSRQSDLAAEGCVAISKGEYDGAKRDKLLREPFGAYMATGSLWHHAYWLCRD